MTDSRVYNLYSNFTIDTSSDCILNEWMNSQIHTYKPLCSETYFIIVDNHSNGL